LSVGVFFCRLLVGYRVCRWEERVYAACGYDHGIYRGVPRPWLCRRRLATVVELAVAGALIR